MILEKIYYKIKEIIEVIDNRLNIEKEIYTNILIINN